MLDYVEIYKPRMDSLKLEVVTAPSNTIRVFTNEVRVAQGSFGQHQLLEQQSYLKFPHSWNLTNDLLSTDTTSIT